MSRAPPPGRTAFGSDTGRAMASRRWRAAQRLYPPPTPRAPAPSRDLDEDLPGSGGRRRPRLTKKRLAGLKIIADSVRARAGKRVDSYAGFGKAHQHEVRAALAFLDSLVAWGDAEAAELVRRKKPAPTLWE